MRRNPTAGAAVLLLALWSLLASSGAALAAGELKLFNWADYTSPELIAKFEKQYDVKVTTTDFASNAEALEKIQAGGNDFDLVVLSARYVPVFIRKGLLLRARPDRMENFKNVAQEWRNPDWDRGRRYTAPWQWGSFGTVVDTDVYKGDIDTSGIIFDPPKELVGRINVPPSMKDVIDTALYYVGARPCTASKTALDKVRDLLVSARRKWKSMDYGIVETMPRGDFAAALYWNDAALRARQAKPSLRFGYPKEGFPLWMDSLAILRRAKNVENAKLFMNFIMAPQNAALISAQSHYANAITGSDAYLPAAMKDAPEMKIPADFLKAGHFTPECSERTKKRYSEIWAEVAR